MAYSKQQLYKITSRLYREIKSNPDYIILRKLRGKDGEYDYGTDEISLDYRGELLSTLIHEYLHKWYPDKCETWVLQNERIIVNALSPLQIKRLLYKFAHALYNM